MKQQLSEDSIVKIDFGALKHNVERLSGYLDNTTGIMAVVKANAYGHGAVEFSRFLEKMDRIKGFAVNTVEEGIELRENGIQKPVLVFGVPAASEAGAYTRFDLTATVSALHHFEVLKAGTAYHLNFNTGMGRIGIPPGAAPEARERVDKFESLNCTGVYSHLATADESSSGYALRQIQRFVEIAGHFPDEVDLHLANTGGLAFYPGSHFDFVRAGIGLYGYPPGREQISGLKPVLSWKSHLAQVMNISKGESVSYGATWSAPRDGWIGTIPVGYYDGVSRGLSGQLEVKIREKSIPVVGTITMNFIMVYLEENITEGTEVTLLDDDLPASGWAEKLETITYEVLTSIRSGIERRTVLNSKSE